MDDTIYTHDEAADIVDLFEAVLDKYDIYVPSPEDNERCIENGAKLYGSVYSQLLDDVESAVINLVMKASARPKVIMNVFS